MTEQQLKALPQEIFIRSIINMFDISKPFHQNVSPLIQDILAKDSKLQTALSKELEQKINAEFAKDPTIKVNESYIDTLTKETLAQLNPDATIDPMVILFMTEDQLDALPPKIMVRYFTDQINLFESGEKYNALPTTSLDYLRKHKNALNSELEEALSKKVNDFVSQNITTLINHQFLKYLTPENQTKLADYIAQEIDLTQSLKNQTKPYRFKEYARNSDEIPAFWKVLESKIKAKVNRSFKENPDLTMDYSYIKYINTSTIKNLKLNDGQKISFTLFKTMNAKQLKAFKPETLQKIIENYTAEPNSTIKNYSLSEIYTSFAKIADQLTPEQIKILSDMTKYIHPKELLKMQFNQIEALSLNELSLEQFNALLLNRLDIFSRMDVKKIILSVLKKIKLSKQFKNQKDDPNLIQGVIHNLLSLFNSLSPEQLQDLATESIDPEVKDIAQEILQKKHSSDLEAEQKALQTQLDEQQKKVAQLKQQLAKLTQAQGQERATLEDELEDAQAQVAEYEEFKKIIRKIQQEIIAWEKDYEEKHTMLLDHKKHLERNLETQLNLPSSLKTHPDLPVKDKQISELQQQLNELNEELAKSEPSTEAIDTSSENIPQPKPAKIKASTPKEFIPTEEEIETQTQNIQTKIQNAQTKISELEAQIQTAQKTHSATVADLEQKLQTAKEQIAEYEKNKQIFREMSLEADTEKFKLDQEFQNLARNNDQLRQRLTAILDNTQDELIASLTQEVNQLRVKLGKKPLQEPVTTVPTPPAHAENQPIAPDQAEPEPIDTPKPGPEKKDSLKKTSKTSLSGFKGSLENPEHKFEEHQNILGTRPNVRNIFGPEQQHEFGSEQEHQLLGITPNLKRNVVIPGWDDTYSFDDPLTTLGISTAKKKGSINPDDI